VEHRAKLVPLLNEVLGARPAEDWLKRLEAAGVPAGRIRTVPEVCESEHLKARGMIVTLSHPKARRVTVMGVPVRLHATPGSAATAPPVLGQHTAAVLTRLVGLKKPAIARLRAAGVV
jgi:formyl-CoA transferase